MHTLTHQEKAEFIKATAKLAHYVLDNGTALVPLNFNNARQALADYASTVDCNLIALTYDVSGHCDVLYRNGKATCYVADFAAIKKIAKSSSFEAGDSFFDGMRLVDTYSEDELENLQIF